MSGTGPFAAGLYKLGALALAAFAIFAGCSSGDLLVTTYDPSTGRRTETVFSKFFEETDYLIEKKLGVYVVMSLEPREVPGSYWLKEAFGTLGSGDVLAPGLVTLYLHNLTDSELALLLKGLSYGWEHISLKSQEVRIAPQSHSRVDVGAIPVNRYLRELEVTLVFESAGSEVAKPLRLKRLAQDRFPRPAGLVFPWDSDPICTADTDREYAEGCLAWRKGESARARGMLRPLAERGHTSTQWLMGLMHDVGIPTDYMAAVEWYRKSAERGNAQGQSALAGMYALGRAAPRDYGEALRLYRKAAAQGDGRAEHSLGYMYEAGQGVAVDFVEAAAWYRKAAEKGLPQAQSALAAIYYGGRGVEKDVEKARYWWEKAAARGSLVAIQSIELLGHK